jgi:hypothetical protein
MQLLEVAWYTLWDRICSILYSKDHVACFMQSLLTNCSRQNGESWQWRHYHTNCSFDQITSLLFPPFQSCFIYHVLTRITSGFGGGEFTKTLRKVCTCQKLKFSFLLIEYCKIRECYAVANAFQIYYKINLIKSGVSKWAGTRYFYPPEIVYSTDRNYWTPQN